MHVAFALMIGVPLALLAKHRAVRWFWTAYPLLVTFVIVMTANHFVFDAVLGALTAALRRRAAVWLARARPGLGLPRRARTRHRLMTRHARFPASAARRCATR